MPGTGSTRPPLCSPACLRGRREGGAPASLRGSPTLASSLIPRGAGLFPNSSSSPPPPTAAGEPGAPGGGAQRRPSPDPAALAPLPPAAVVGAGLGGSAVAYFLQQHFGPQVQLDVYEPAGVGGRLATVTVNKQQYESRGASIHALSLHMLDFVKILGERGHPSAWRPPSLSRGGLGCSPPRPGPCAWGSGEGCFQSTSAPQACGHPLAVPVPQPCRPLEEKGTGWRSRSSGRGVLVELAGGRGGGHKLPPVCPSRQRQLHGILSM